MSWALADVKTLASIFQAVVTSSALIVGGLWAYWKFVRAADRYPHVESSADIIPIGQQDDYWIVELVGYLENKGTVQQTIKNFDFDLFALFEGERVETNEKWGNQIDFSNKVAAGSFKPERYQFFFIDAGVKAKYSYVTRVPKRATFLIFHCWFEYDDKRKFAHAAERTICLRHQQAAQARATAGP